MLEAMTMDEFIDILDQSGNLIGRKLRGEAHRSGEWHKGVHVWILSNGKILLQKRSYKKDILPGRFDVGCGGHVKSGENYEDAAIRETEEELGIKPKKEDLIYIDSRKQITHVKEKGLISREFLKIFVLKIPDISGLKINRDEVEEVRLFDIKELKELLKTRLEMFIDDKEYFFDALNKIEKIKT